MRKLITRFPFYFSLSVVKWKNKWFCSIMDNCCKVIVQDKRIVSMEFFCALHRHCDSLYLYCFRSSQ